MPVLLSETDRLIQQANTLFLQGHGRDAMALLHDILRQDQGNLLALAKLAEIEVERKDIASAMPRLEAILRAQPNFAPALSTLGQACWIAGNPWEGLRHARRAVEVQPPNPHYRLILGQLCVWLGRFDEARALGEALLDPALYDPNIRTRAYGLLGELDVARGAFREARAAFQAALDLSPDHPQSRMNHGMNLLRLGEFEAGWESYAWRDKVTFFHPDGMPNLPGRRWMGEALFGRSILLQDDQGFGDAIQFCRYHRLLKQAGAERIVHVTYPPLASLLSTSGPAEVVTAMPTAALCDVHCLTSDLPFLLRTRMDTIPSETPYLRAKPALPPATDGRLRIGLVWSGDRRHLRDHQRSIPAGRFLAMTDDVDATFYSLQFAVRDTDRSALLERPGIARVDMDAGDFADTAALVASLDLVITVDTSMAHLAGALGKPVWIMLPLAPDWRWLTDRDDSPWYPTARLFRADLRGWGRPLKQAERALKALVTKQRQRGKRA